MFSMVLDYNADMNDECVEVLGDFYYFTEFVQQVRKGTFSLDARILKTLKYVY